MLIKQSYRIR